MLSMGILSIALGIFGLWIMQNGQNFITADNFSLAVAQTVGVISSWLQGQTPSKAGK